MPECSKTPADAKNKTNYIIINPCPPRADIIKDFATKPLNKGNAEIDIAPTMQKIVVKGIYL